MLHSAAQYCQQKLFHTYHTTLVIYAHAHAVERIENGLSQPTFSFEAMRCQYFVAILRSLRSRSLRATAALLNCEFVRVCAYWRGGDMTTCVRVCQRNSNQFSRADHPSNARARQLSEY